ncbi:MAG: hypothetical protein ACQEP1_06730 [Nanobdellota archaeon]
MKNQKPELTDLLDKICNGESYKDIKPEFREWVFESLKEEENREKEVLRAMKKYTSNRLGTIRLLGKKMISFEYKHPKKKDYRVDLVSGRSKLTKSAFYKILESYYAPRNEDYKGIRLIVRNKDSPNYDFVRLWKNESIKDIKRIMDSDLETLMRKTEQGDVIKKSEELLNSLYDKDKTGEEAREEVLDTINNNLFKYYDERDEITEENLDDNLEREVFRYFFFNFADNYREWYGEDNIKAAKSFTSELIRAHESSLQKKAPFVYEKNQKEFNSYIQKINTDNGKLEAMIISADNPFEMNHIIDDLSRDKIKNLQTPGQEAHTLDDMVLEINGEPDRGKTLHMKDETQDMEGRRYGNTIITKKDNVAVIFTDYGYDEYKSFEKDTLRFSKKMLSEEKFKKKKERKGSWEESFAFRLNRSDIDDKTSIEDPEMNGELKRKKARRFDLDDISTSTNPSVKSYLRTEGTSKGNKYEGIHIYMKDAEIQVIPSSFTYWNNKYGGASHKLYKEEKPEKDQKTGKIDKFAKETANEKASENHIRKNLIKMKKGLAMYETNHYLHDEGPIYRNLKEFNENKDPYKYISAVRSARRYFEKAEEEEIKINKKREEIKQVLEHTLYEILDSDAVLKEQEKRDSKNMRNNIETGTRCTEALLTQDFFMNEDIYRIQENIMQNNLVPAYKEPYKGTNKEKRPIVSMEESANAYARAMSYKVGERKTKDTLLRKIDELSSP